MRTEYSPLDRRSRADARRAGESQKWEASLRLNVRCAKAIEHAIERHSAGGVLESGAAEEILERYGFARVSFVLAGSLNRHIRNISDKVSDWSMSVKVPYDPKYTSQFMIHASDALLDAFVRQVWEARQKLGLYGMEHCAGDWGCEDYQDRVLLLNADGTDRNLTSLKEQLWYAADGLGCRPENCGCSIRAVRLADGGTEILDRGDFAGVLDERYRPDWAAEKLAELRTPQQKQPEAPSGGMEMT